MTKTIFLLLVGCFLIISSGCTGPGLAGSSPVGNSPGLVVSEYALVEQSVDNPDHAEFAEFARVTVKGSHANRFHNENETEAINTVLNPYDMHLEGNPVPPYSGYALYQGKTLLQAGIAHFWPVSYDEINIDDPGDFSFPFETFQGEKLIASSQGITPGPASQVKRPAWMY